MLNTIIHQFADAVDSRLPDIFQSLCQQSCCDASQERIRESFSVTETSIWCQFLLSRITGTIGNNDTHRIPASASLPADKAHRQINITFMGLQSKTERSCKELAQGP